MSTDFDIRMQPATERDLPLVLEFIRALAEYERLSHEVTATEDLLRHWMFGPNKVAEAVIAYDGDEPVGFALYFHNFSTFLGRAGLYLEDLFVKPHARGRGIGKMLLRHLARIAVERGCGRFEWWVLDWNVPSIEFYKRMGAVPMDEWTVFRVTGDALANLAKGGA
jgi:GNAT superfamily N-acetyltransferase